MRNIRSLFLILSLLVAGSTGSLAQTSTVEITALESSGQLVFERVPHAVGYRVEWAPTASGPWTNFTGGTGQWLDYIPGAGSGSVTALVPMLYRVITTTNPPLAQDYLIVDLAAGPSASNYPVSYLPAVPGGGWTDAHKTTKLVFRRIPAGSYYMGSPVGELGRSPDEVLHQVTISQPFYIGVFEVTQKQWERVMGNYPSWFTNLTHRDSRPVEQVSYWDIRGTANWPTNSLVDTNSFMGRLRSRTGMAFDLPTESQWEYAGRAGTVTALNSGFNLTNTSSDFAMSAVGRYWYNGGSGYTQNGDASVGTAKAGSYVPNAWGLYDIHGNVLEWCLDWYGTYPGTVTDPLGPTSGSGRVGRGGGWDFFAVSCRSAQRVSITPVNADNSFGFRAVLPPGQ